MITTITISCPLPGFEGVQVTFNLLASEAQYDAFMRSLARDAADVVITEITGWPSGTPFDADTPLLFRLWLAQDGYIEAVKAYLRPTPLSTA